MKILQSYRIFIFISFFIFTNSNCMNPIIEELVSEISYGIPEGLLCPLTFYNLRTESNNIEKLLGLLKLSLLLFLNLKKKHSKYNVELNLELNPAIFKLNMYRIRYFKTIGKIVGLYLTYLFRKKIIKFDRFILEHFYNFFLRFCFNNIFKNELINENDICVICRENNQAAYSGVTICNHTFHKYCLKKWLLLEPICPTCRHNLIVLNQ